jgi:hypothetical protein
MATNKNFEVKNGLTIAGTERISSAGAFTGSLASATTATTQSATDNSTKIATTAYTDAAITAVIGGAPGTLDTLNELAAAINDDASYASTLTTALATKLPLAGGTMTGNLVITSEGDGLKLIRSGYDSYSLQQSTGNGLAIYNVTDSRAELFFKGDGNVGIGTTSPQRPLHVNGTEGVLRLTSTASGNNGFEVGVGTSSQAFLWNAENSHIEIATNNAERMRITSTGNVGIGNSSCLQKLHISNGTILIGSDSNTTQTNNLLNGYGYRIGSTLYGSVGIRSSYNSGNNQASLDFYTEDTERMRIDASGHVGIGTAAPAYKLDIVESSSEYGARLTNNHDSSDGLLIRCSDNDNNRYIINCESSTSATGTNYASKFLVTKQGNVSVGGNLSPSAKLYVSGKDDAGASDLLALQFDNSPADTGITFRDIFDGIKSRFTIDSSNTNDLRISTSTQMHLYGGTSNGTGDGHLKINSSGHFTSTYGVIVSAATFAEVSNVGFGSYNNGAWVNSKSSTNGWLATAGNGVLRWSTGSVFVNGSLSKNSGSFKIPHPLPSKNSTHALVHSFIEGPQADNIYRGVIDLVDGTATINIDTVSGMTEGTYVLLNTNTSCFTSNETNWDAVKGSVSGNILTINCQNSSSTATVSWLVIGERHDQHMKDTDWTDSDGKVIVEPLKEQEVNLGD